MPDPLNAGVPAGTTLTTITGDYSMSNGETLTGKHITGDLYVPGTQSNMSVINCHIDGSVTINLNHVAGNYTLPVPTNVLFQNCEFEQMSSLGFNGLTLDGVKMQPQGTSGTTITNFQAYDYLDGSGTYAASNLTIKNSWLKAQDPYFWDGTGTKPHSENLHMAGVQTAYIYNSRFELTASGPNAANTMSTMTACITLDTQSPSSGAYNKDVVIDHCYLIGANNYMLYFDADGTNQVSNTAFDNTASGAATQYPVSAYSGGQLPGGTYHYFSGGGNTLNGAPTHLDGEL